MTTFTGDRSEPNEEGRSSPGVDEVNSTTRRFPRTMHSSDAAFPRDSDYANPYDWWVSAEAAIAQEQHIREMFEESPRRSCLRCDVWAACALCGIAAGVIGALAWGWL